MDPITGIGLAASVIQLVTASIDAAKTCRELYQQGSVSEYSNLDYTTGRLASLTRSLQQSLQSSGARSPALTREEKDLVDLAGKCEDCANKLQRELHKLQTQPRASALEVARHAARAIWKRNRIDKIQQQLQAYRSTLETSLLSRLSQRFDAQGLLNDKSFANLDRSLQQIIMCLAKSQTRLTELVEKESEETRRSITAQFDRAERLQIRHRRYEEIFNSLFYPDIFSRQEQVDDQFDGITDSYDWIFQEPQTYRMSKSNDSSPQNLAHRWDDFSSWLKSGHGVYWINGKAGSGKSTIMKHICDHSRKLELLQEWASSRRLLTPTFFFWNAGSRLQKSIDGLLRSLLYQMLKECHDLVGCFTDEPLYTWTQSRLLTTLRNLMSQSQVPVAICMFIDGLDEFEGREDTVVKMIEALADQAHVKVCLSSRPLLIFEEAFHGRPNLKLQDLTFDTIRDYAEKQLSELIETHVSLNKDDGYLAQDLLTRIVKRADGVFLWAIIAIRDVRDGLRGFANLKELSQTIETLPSELESLFMLMLRRIKRAFMQDAAYFLGIALYQGSIPHDGMDLCRLHFSHSQRGQKDAPFSSEEITTDKLVASCRILKTRLLSHTGGLLELTSLKPSLYPHGLYGEGKDHDPILFTEIKFVHRTARDFLLENNGAKSFLTHNGSSEAQIRLSIARGTLAQLLHFSQGDYEIIDGIREHPIYSPYLGALHHISMAEKLLGTAQAKLMRSLDYESLARDYLVTKGRIRALISPEPFIVIPWATSIDLVGMAAATGMTLYVCERLDLDTESRRDSFSLPDLYNYSRNRTTVVKLSWNGGGQSRDMITSSATRLPPSEYRQALARCLQWETDTSLSSWTGTTTRDNRLAETYMLSCCRTWHADLVWILLQVGANPMVVIVPDGTSTPSPGLGKCFWERWLEKLSKLHQEQLRSTWGFSEWRFRLETNTHITFQDIFDITKGLLAQGADINYQIEDRYDWHLKRQPTFKHSIFTLTVSAMFILEMCFNAEPEFREFAVAMEPLIETPKRKFVDVCPSLDLYRLPEGFEIWDPCPSAEESSLLWPLIEKWEDTGSCDDEYALTLAIGEVWRAHNPGVKLRRLSDQLSNDDESDDSD